MATILGRETHPDADRFPMLEGFTRKAVVADVKANGFRNPRLYVLPDGRWIDGRNRASIAEELGPEYVAMLEIVTIDGDPESLAKSLNLHRRNMNSSVRALVASSFATRQRGRPKKTGARAELGPTDSQLAEEHDVSEREIRDGKTVRDHGIPELVTAVHDEHLTISAAAEIALLEPEAQRQALETTKPPTRDQLRRQRAQNSNQKVPPGEYLLSQAVRTFEKLGATIETLEAGHLLVRFDDQTFELELRPAKQQGRAA